MIAHHSNLVILSAAIAILGAFTACIMTSNLAALGRSERRGHLVMASAALGGSLWAMQFIGLLALDAPLNFAYNPVPLAISAAAAFTGTTASLLVLGARRTWYPARLPAAAIILGTAIAVTNYAGLFAVAGPRLSFLWFLTLVSIAVSVQVAAIALWFLFRRRGAIATLAGAGILGLCLSATHYMAIASAQNLEQALLAVPAYGNAISERYLAWSVTIITYMICSICLCIFVVGQFRDEAG